MSMPAPRFAVGETVLLFEHNGLVKGAEAVVVDRFWAEENYCALTGIQYPPEWNYVVTPDPIALPHDSWGERELRKKPRTDHTPADEEFTEWMRDLQRPREVVV